MIIAWKDLALLVTLGTLLIPGTAICGYRCWKTSGLVSRNAGSWPPARREISRLVLSLEVPSEAAYQKLSEREQVLWDICQFTQWFENSGLCGGLHDFFWNASGNHALATVDALDKIGAHNTAGFLRQACSFFPNQEPSTRLTFRREQMDGMDTYPNGPVGGISNPMVDWAYDHPYYGSTNRKQFGAFDENFFDLLLEYWNKHP